MCVASVIAFVKQMSLGLSIHLSLYLIAVNRNIICPGQDFTAAFGPHMKWMNVTSEKLFILKERGCNEEV